MGVELLFPGAIRNRLLMKFPGLLGDDEKRLSLGARAADYGRDMGWPIVAQPLYGKLRAGDRRLELPHTAGRV